MAYTYAHLVPAIGIRLELTEMLGFVAHFAQAPHYDLDRDRSRGCGSPRLSLVRREAMSGDDQKRREKQTLIPAFDPETLAREIEASSDRPTITPPYDSSSYARIVDEHVSTVASDARDTPRTITAAMPSISNENAIECADSQSASTMGRAMYGNYLQSNYPEAMVLAERVLEREPDHALAKLVFEGCRARLGPSSEAPRLVPSSVVRLKRPAYEVAEIAQLESDVTSQIVLEHVDGVADVAMVAELAGIPRPEALDRLHALLDLGMLEVVNG
jgi:hypothetical protein